MKFIYNIFVLLTIFGTLTCAAIWQGTYNDPKNPGKCTVDEKTILSPGDVIKHPKDCVRMTCEEGGWIEFTSCGIQEFKKGCDKTDKIDESLPYPDCCRQHVNCAKFNATETTT